MRQWIDLRLGLDGALLHRQQRAQPVPARELRRRMVEGRRRRTVRRGPAVIPPPPTPLPGTALQARYRALGSQGSPLGASASTEYNATRGRTQRFVHGRMYHSNATGTHYLLGSIATVYVHADGTGGPLGLPTSDTRHNADGKGRHNIFQHGS